MATYTLSATDLLTLLQSTETSSTVGTILDTLVHNSLFPAPTIQVQTDGPVGTVPANNNLVINPGTQFEQVVIPTSTDVTGAIYPPPTIAASTTPATTFNFLSPGNVVIAAGDQNVHINDTSGGSDTLIGGAGAERLHTVVGNNLLIAGTGLNTLVGGVGADTMRGGGQSRLVGMSNGQVLIGGLVSGASDTMVGGAGNETLMAGQGNNRLVDTAGTGTLYAGSGNDTLIGGTGDSLTSSTGDARMVATKGTETLTGGSGSDTMIASGQSANAFVSGGSGVFRIVDETTSSSTVTGGSGGGNLVLGGHGTDSVLGGSGAMTIHSLQGLGNLVSNSSTATGGLHTLTFADGQVVTINDANSNITIHFAGGGTTAT
jgi:Ca2+-binding RTX toxin-like protein